MGDIYTNPPQSRNEAILRATIDGTEYTAPPQSRIEDLLLELKEAIEQGGGAGGMSKDTYDPDDVVADAGGIATYVDDEITDLHLGTASTKNSTSVVTQSTDLVESGAVYDALGFGNKNLLNITLAKLKTNNPIGTWNGNTLTHNGGSITFVESDGFVTSISISGTVTTAFNIRLTDTTNLGHQGKILNGTVDVSKEYLFAYDDILQNSAEDLGNGVTIPDTFTSYRIVLNIKAVAHNEVVYPMISKGGGAYEPYHASVEEYCASKELLEDTVGWIGENFINPESYIEKSKTLNGITFTIDDNGNVTVNGTSTSQVVNLLITVNSNPVLTVPDNNASYVFSCDYVTEGSYGLYFNLYNGNTQVKQDVATLYGVSEETVDLSPYTFDKIIMGFYCPANTTFNNAVFKPAIRKPSVNETKADNSVIAPTENGTTIQKSGGYAVGSHAIRNGAFITWKNAKAQGETINDASDYTSGDVAEFLKESDVTITAGTNVTVNANTHVYKKNGIIVGTLRLTIGATLTQQSKIATLPASKNIQYFIAIDNVNASVIPVILNANGNMELFSAFVPENGHDLIIPICYVASN